MTVAPLAEQVLARIEGAGALYHRLILVVDPSGSRKTKALREVAEGTGARLVNVNLELSRRMLELTARDRALRLPDLLDEVVGRSHPLVLLDNVEFRVEHRGREPRNGGAARGRRHPADPDRRAHRQ